MSTRSLQLVSHPLCPFVHRATALLLEKGVEFETRYVDLSAKPDWFLAISPRGKVPVLVADGIPLFESAPILEFLDETQRPPRILPEDPFERARERAWIEVANDLFAAHYKLVISTTHDELDAARQGFDNVLSRFEQAVRGEFFAGDALGIVDFAAAPILFRLRLLERWTGLELTSHRPVGAWVARLATRPSVVRGVRDDFEASYRASLAARSTLLLGAAA